MAPKIFPLHVVADIQAPNRLDHQRDAADLMRIVAAGEDPIGAREVEREADRRRIEVHRVVVEVPQVLGRRPIDVLPAVSEGPVAAIEASPGLRGGRRRPLV